MTTELSRRLVELFAWVDPGPTSTHLVSDNSGWWREPEVLAGIGPALVAPFRAARPTVVVAPAVTGLLIGPLAATALRVGFVAAYKPDDRRLPGPVTWAESPPDYRGRRVRLGVLHRHLHPGDRVLMVDDWVATGAQLSAVHHICTGRGAQWVGAATIVADCPPAVAAEFRVHALLHGADLHPDAGTGPARRAAARPAAQPGSSPSRRTNSSTAEQT